ncbi:hypothetical protein BSL78_09673 [Apostichopus japonicus]|uniref:PHD-type domain-containing protein n=1 Tax=Stichopus japonicus TaxID=307972 RepID=A0A2G8KZJ4_STIJA|nr:hypothetical protein BSL78_09673 [Apostichopus japonicus]
MSKETESSLGLRKGNRIARQVLTKTVQKMFPWSDVDKSNAWEKNKKYPDGMLPNAVLPPNLDHHYALWKQDEDWLSPLPQPSMLRELTEDERKALKDQGEVADPRRCVLCGKLGDDEPDKAGRLLYCGQDEWIHINCALWSAEVFEEVDGSLVNVHTAIYRGRHMRCEHCSNLGATVGCCQAGCPANYHFICARNSRAVFQEDKRVYCERHTLSAKREVIESNFAVARRVSVSLENIKWNRTQALGLEPTTVKVLVGSLTVEVLGRLGPLSDTRKGLFPLEFRCSRVFWSTKSAGKRSVYSIRIYEEQKPLEDITDLSPIEKTSENNFTTAHTPGGKAALRETTDGSEVMRTLPNESESSEGGGFINPSDRLVAPENAIEDVNEQSSAMRAMVDLIKSGQFPDMDSDKDSKLGGKLAEASKGAGIVRQPLHNDTQTSNEMTSLQVEEMAKVNSAQEGQLSSGQRSDSEAVPLQSQSKVISGKDPEVMNSNTETKVSSSAISSQQSLSSSISETFTQDNMSSSRTDLNSAPSGANSSGNVAMATVEEDSDSNVITLVLDDTLNLSEDIAIQFVDDSSIGNQDTEADTGGSVEEQKEGGNEQAVNIGELQDKLSALSRSVENALCTNAAAKSKESKDGSVIEESSAKNDATVAKEEGAKSKESKDGSVIEESSAKNDATVAKEEGAKSKESKDGSVIEESSAKNDATVAKEEGGRKETSGSSSEISVKNVDQSSETVGQRKELLGNDVGSEPISSEKSPMRNRTKSDSNASPDEDGISSANISKSSRIGESDEVGNHGEKVSLNDDAPPADIPKAQNNNDDVTVRNLGGRKLVVKLDDCQTTSEEMEKKADEQSQDSSPTKTVRQAGLDENLEILAQTAIEFLEIQNLLEDNRPDQKAAETKVDKSDPPERPLLNNTSDHSDVDSSSKGQYPTKAAEKLKFDTFVAEEHLDTFDLTPPGRKKYPMRTTSSRILRVVNHKEEGVAGPQPVSEENPPPSISPQSDKLNMEVSKAAEDTSSNDIGSAMKSPESVRRSRRGRPPKVKTDDESAKKKEVKSPPALPPGEARDELLSRKHWEITLTR